MVVVAGGSAPATRRTYSADRRDTVRHCGRSTSCSRLWFTQKVKNVTAGKARASASDADHTAATCGSR